MVRGTVGRGEHGRPQRATLPPLPGDRARQLLADLVDLYESGLCAPLPLPLKAGERYADARHRGLDGEKALELAATTWAGAKFAGENQTRRTCGWGPGLRRVAGGRRGDRRGAGTDVGTEVGTGTRRPPGLASPRSPMRPPASRTGSPSWRSGCGFRCCGTSDEARREACRANHQHRRWRRRWPGSRGDREVTAHR